MRIPENHCMLLPLIPKSMLGAQSAPSQMSRDYRPCHAVLLNWQVMGSQPELHQPPELGKRDGKLNIGLRRHLAWSSKPAQIRARFCASRGSRTRRIMQTSPIPLVCTTHVPPEGVGSTAPTPAGPRKGDCMPGLEYILSTPAAQLPHKGPTRA